MVKNDHTFISRTRGEFFCHGKQIKVQVRIKNKQTIKLEAIEGLEPMFELLVVLDYEKKLENTYIVNIIIIKVIKHLAC